MYAFYMTAAVARATRKTRPSRNSLSLYLSPSVSHTHTHAHPVEMLLGIIICSPYVKCFPIPFSLTLSLTHARTHAGTHAHSLAHSLSRPARLIIIFLRIIFNDRYAVALFMRGPLF